MIISVKVKPNSSENSVEKSESGEIIVRVKARAEDNKANIAVIKALSKYYNVPSQSIKIKSGLRNSKKIVELKE
jgi:uncharacterized protein YggU (UPF0235/DUF167 family)